MSAITVGTVSYYSAALIAGLLESIEQTALARDFIYLVADNSNGADTELYAQLDGCCRIVPLEPQTPSAWRARSRAASYAHGEALNHLFSEIDTEFGLFVDPDCLVLMPGWDEIIVQALQSAIAIGAPYHVRKVTKYQDFPSPIFIAFRTEELRSLGADWTPYLVPARVELQDQIGRLVAIIGDRLGVPRRGDAFYRGRTARYLHRAAGRASKDTGWRLAARARIAGLQSVLFTPAIGADQIAEPFASNDAVLGLMCDHELFLWQGTPILTHFYGYPYWGRDATGAQRRWEMLAESVRARF
jgi:hypothetical protein